MAGHALAWEMLQAELATDPIDPDDARTHLAPIAVAAMALGDSAAVCFDRDTQKSAGRQSAERTRDARGFALDAANALELSAQVWRAIAEALARSMDAQNEASR